MKNQPTIEQFANMTEEERAAHKKAAEKAIAKHMLKMMAIKVGIVVAVHYAVKKLTETDEDEQDD